jgi:hypothetical protein
VDLDNQTGKTGGPASQHLADTPHQYINLRYLSQDSSTSTRGYKLSLETSTKDRPPKAEETLAGDVAATLRRHRINSCNAQMAG